MLFLKVAEKILFAMVSVDNDFFLGIAVDLDLRQQIALQPVAPDCSGMNCVNSTFSRA